MWMNSGNYKARADFPLRQPRTYPQIFLGRARANERLSEGSHLVNRENSKNSASVCFALFRLGCKKLLKPFACMVAFWALRFSYFWAHLALWKATRSKLSGIAAAIPQAANMIALWR
jgi:hypothetical protein